MADKMIPKAPLTYTENCEDGGGNGLCSLIDAKGRHLGEIDCLEVAMALVDVYNGESIDMAKKMKPKPPLRVNPIAESDGSVDLIDAEGNYIASTNDKGCAQALVDGYKPGKNILMGTRDIDKAQTVVKYSCRECGESVISWGDNFCSCCGTKLRWVERTKDA